MRYQKGDELILKVEDNFGYADRTFRAVKVQVIGFNVDSTGPEAEYLVYVPPYSHMVETWQLTKMHADWYGVASKFIGEDVVFIPARHPTYKHMPATQGEWCSHCKEFFAGAVRGTDDDRFTCSACRMNPWR